MRRKIDTRLRRTGLERMGRVMAGSSLGLLGLIALAFIFPIAENDTQALAVYVGDRTLTPAIGLSLVSTNEWEVNPEAQQGEASLSTELLVSASGASGYKLYLSGKDGQTSLRSMDTSNTTEISSISASSTLSSFPANTWGYSISKETPASNAVYQAIPSENNTIALEETLGEAKVNRYNLSFATKVNSSLPAGAYTGGVVVSVVATPWQVHTLSDLTYMQDMTSYVCDYSAEHETKQLIDNRDGKSYWVAKLKDGHCWMTQNLALDLVAGTTLTSADTDLADTETGSWTIPKSTTSEIPLPNTGDNTDTQSWNLGELVLTKPTNSSACPKQDSAVSGVPGQTYPNNDQYNNAFTGQNIADACSDQVIDVSNGWIADANHEGYSATISTIEDNTGRYYDPHYLFGNYYQYNTATAGSAIGVTGTVATNADGTGLTNATSSICPKGWQLPKAGNNSSITGTVFGVGPGQSYDIDGSFYHLLKTYGYDSAWIANGGNGFMSINHADRTANLSGDPIYFVRNGSVNPNSGALRNVGNYGDGWSSTVYPSSTSHSYSLGLGTAIVAPSDNYNRYGGFPVRCLAKF